MSGFALVPKFQPSYALPFANTANAGRFGLMQWFCRANHLHVILILAGRRYPLFGTVGMDQK
jgi:hypothetical protein